MKQIQEAEFSAWKNFKELKKPLDQLTINDFKDNDANTQFAKDSNLTLDEQKKLILLHEHRLQDLHKTCTDTSKRRTTNLGCFFCGHIVKKELTPFIKRQSIHKTLLCPYCEVDSLVDIGQYSEADQKKLLENMSQRWFKKWPSNTLTSLKNP